MIKVELRELGTIKYQACYNQMIELINESPKFHSIWVLEHEPVFTPVSNTHLTLPTICSV